MIKKTKSYKGKLNTKIVHKEPVMPTIMTGLLDDDVKAKYLEECKKYASKVTMEKMLKLLSLLDHYEIDCTNSVNPFLELSLKMAEVHVPGFAVQNGIKRKPTTWNPIKQVLLYMDVESFIEANKNLSENAACLWLQNNKEPWKKEKTAKNIYNRFIESKNSPLVALYINLKTDPRATKIAMEDFRGMVEKLAETQKLPE